MPSAEAQDRYENRLVDRFRQGDANALSTLFELYVDRVYGYAFQLLGTREDAEEIASEAFIRVFRRAADYRGECPFRGWLFAITRNLCRDRQRQPQLLTVPILPDDQSVVSDDSVRQALRVDVRRAMAALQEDYQDVLILCDVEQWDGREVADVLGKSLAATKSLLYRARRALRESLREQWNEHQ